MNPCCFKCCQGHLLHVSPHRSHPPPVPSSLSSSPVGCRAHSLAHSDAPKNRQEYDSTLLLEDKGAVVQSHLEFAALNLQKRKRKKEAMSRNGFRCDGGSWKRAEAEGEWEGRASVSPGDRR